MNIVNKGYIFYNIIKKNLVYVYFNNTYKIIVYNFNLHIYIYNLLILKPILMYEYRKILIKSKIYRIFSNKKKTQLFPHINYFHIIRIFIFFNNVANFKKKLILFSLNSWTLYNTINNLLKFKKINIFTYRGFKVSRAVTYKKTGKVAKYF